VYVRIGCALGVHVDPVYVLVDEFLAGGDEGFQCKCLDRVRQFQKEGRTIVFVTHAVHQVLEVCQSAVLLQQGSVQARGDPHEVVRAFRLIMLEKDLAYAWDRGTKEIEIVSAEIFRSDGSTPEHFLPGDEVVIQMDLKANAAVEDPVVSFALHDQHNQFVFGTNTDWRGVRWPRFEGKHRVQFVMQSLPLVDGRYFVTLGVHSRDSSQVYHVQEQQYSFRVAPGEDNPGPVYISVRARSERL